MLTDSSDLSVKSAEGKAGQRGQCVNSLVLSQPPGRGQGEGQRKDTTGVVGEEPAGHRENRQGLPKITGP